PLRMVMSGSAPMPHALAAEISRRFAAPLIFDYGLSEAPCLALSDPAADPSADPRYLPLIPGTIRIAGSDGEPLPPGEEGQILARGPIVFPGSIGAAAPELDAAGWYATGDLGVLDPEGRFRVTGRLKHLVNRGGEMISPREIERAREIHPAVAEAAVVGVPHPILGEDLEAFVVLRPGFAAPARELRRWLLDRLPPTHTPRTITFRASLPRNAAGKVDRRALVAGTLSGRDSGAAPR
ncbi:MAG: class I adenylate-forming enzyme family protein, partial [Chloroflexota bacterium]